MEESRTGISRRAWLLGSAGATVMAIAPRALAAPAIVPAAAEELPGIQPAPQFRVFYMDK
jgi:hypothetical protein